MHVVTGAFGYIGRYICRRLLRSGQRVRTITTHPDKPNPFGPEVEAFPYAFAEPARLTAQLEGASVLYNTYWIRFEYGDATFDRAVTNTRILFECARRAGVEKVVHISVTNAYLDDDLPYYAGKARQEQILRDAGVAYTIVRPTLVFGSEDILVNNMAWLIRRFPVFPIFGDGAYRLQPVFVGDLAKIAVQAASGSDDQELDVIGPETYSFAGLIAEMASHLSPRLRTVKVPPRLGYALGRAIGWLVGDILLTWDELRGLMREKLTSTQEPNGTTAFSAWLAEHQAELGTSYTSELARHYQWEQEA